MRSDESRSRRSALGEEIRRLFAQSCCVAGGLVGLWMGWLAAPRHANSSQLAGALAEVLTPIAWRVGAGVAAGAALVWVLWIAVPWLRPESG